MDDLHKERQRVKKQASTGEVTGSASLFARKTPATPSEATHSADSPTGSLPQLETSDKKTKSPPLEVYLHASQKPPKKKENKQVRILFFLSVQNTQESCSDPCFPLGCSESVSPEAQPLVTSNSWKAC